MDPITTKQTLQLNIGSLLVTHPATASEHVVKHSHFNELINTKDRFPHGRTRRWGDIDTENQLKVIKALIEEAQQQKLGTRQTAFLLALARTESGFNPDAAAKSSSATGIGQFIDSTGRSFGLTAKNRFNLKDNIRALVAHTKENLQQSQKKFQHSVSKQVFSYAYALHHDGPSLQFGGLKIAETIVLPWAHKFQQWLNQRR